jgi:CHAD domain-containing protein
MELKYAVNDAAAVRNLVSTDTVAGLRGGAWRMNAMVDQYIDTQSGALAKAGYGARLRHIDDRTVVTVKGARRGKGRRRKSGPLHDRMELEGRASRRLNPNRWATSAARALIEATAGDERLRTLFFIDQQRDERELVRDGSPVARLSIDTATVRRFGRNLGEFVSLEVEATVPMPEARTVLEAIAAALDGSTHLRPESRSKEELARALVEESMGRGRAGSPPRQPGVVADEQLSEAGRKVLRLHMLRMLAAEPGARAGEDIEAVHKMRVATRRMRAAWRVFDGAYRPRLQRRYVEELRGVARTLGAVRDMDVQLEALDAFRGTLNDERRSGALDPLADELRRARSEARDDLLDLFASADYDDFVTDYLSFVETSGAGALELTGGNRVRDVAAGKIWRAYEMVRAHELIVPHADAAALHALRIDGKRLRYTLEFFREILPPAADKLIAEVTLMQDHLGLLNDAHIAAGITRAWLIESSSDLNAAQRAAGAAYLKACESDAARLRRSFRPIWRRLSGPGFRRRLASVVAAV